MNMKKIVVVILLSFGLVYCVSGQTFITYVYQYQWSLQGGDPAGIALDDSNNSYVTDYSNNWIQKFASNGAFIMRWGTLGSGNGQLNQPMGIAVDAARNVYVTEKGNNRVQKFSST